MRTEKQELTANLNFRPISNIGIATFLFAQAGGYKMIKKEKRNQEKKAKNKIKL